MTHPAGIHFFRGLAIAVGLAAFSGHAAGATAPKVYSGAPTAVGQGSAHVVLVTNAEGKPTSIGVSLDAKALKGLPEATATQHEWDYVLAMPKSGPKTGYDHVVLNWNPKGHVPPGIYDTPHFDVHFYTISSRERDAVTFLGPDKSVMAPPAASLVPKGFVVPPDTAVEKMGLHGINPKGPEFQGKPFTHTFIYGYYKGKTIFVEPMVTKAFLESKPDVTMKIAAPDAYTTPGYYPARYRVAYEAKRDRYVFALAGLKEWKAP